MLIDLSSENLVHMVYGTEPDFKTMQELKKTTLGVFSGSTERWYWNRNQLTKLSGTDLLALYCMVTGVEPVAGTLPDA